MTWAEDIVLALNNLGGIASYDDIYREIENLRSDLFSKMEGYRSTGNPESFQ